LLLLLLLLLLLPTHTLESCVNNSLYLTQAQHHLL
jgi:hypothetical protein